MRAGIDCDGWWIFDPPAVADFIAAARGLTPPLTAHTGRIAA